MAKQKAPYKIAKDGTVTFLNPLGHSKIETIEFGAVNYAHTVKGDLAEAKKIIAACTTKKKLMAQFFPTKAQRAASQARFNANMNYVNNSREVTAMQRAMVAAPDFMPALRK